VGVKVIKVIHQIQSFPWSCCASPDGSCMECVLPTIELKCYKPMVKVALSYIMQSGSEMIPELILQIFRVTSAVQAFRFCA